MRFIRNPWARCKNLSILIVSCTLMIRVLSIGYVIGSFLIRFQDPFLGYTGITLLNRCNLGVFPLGSFINALLFSLIPAFIVNLFNSAIIHIGIYKRRKSFLQISTTISLLILIWYVVLIGLWSWLVGEVYYGIKRSFVSVYSRDPNNWNKYGQSLKCCGADNRIANGNDGCYLVSADACFDVFSNTINTYGSSFIAVLVVNCLAEIIMIVGISSLHGFYAVLFKSTSAKNMDSKEIHKLKNSAIGSGCLSLKEKWTRNKMSTCFGYTSVIFLVIDGTMAIAILLLRYNYYDITLTDEFYQASGGNNMNMGYTKDALLITAICVLLWSVLAKAMYFGGMYLNKRWMFVLHIAFEITVLLVECIIFIFAVILMKAMYCCLWKDTSGCSEYTYFTTVSPIIGVCESWGNAARFLWTSTLILVVHIVLKVLFIIASDKVYKRSFSTTKTSLPESKLSQNGSVGLFKEALLKTKRYPAVATVVVISIVLCIVNSVYLCGLLVVRYGYSSYPFIEVADALNAINLGSLNMSTNRDNGFMICIASLSFSFLLQLGKFVSITWKSHKSTLLRHGHEEYKKDVLESEYGQRMVLQVICIQGLGNKILWLELLVIILQLICLSLVAVSLKLVYCCLDMSNCVFSLDNQLLCDNEQNLWGRFTLQSWLMFGFSILCTVLQISSIISGYRYFKQSDDGHLGIFKGISELFKNIIHTFSNNRYINEKKMPNYNKTYAFYCILSTTNLALELVFVVSVFAYYFTEGDSSYLIDGLNRFTYYRYYMGSLYKGVIITTLTIIPLAASLRIAAFIWFGFRKSKIPLYTIVVFISIWTLGEVTVLSYVSYLLRLAYGCIDSDSFTFSNVFWRPDRNNVCSSFNPKLFVQSGLTVAYLVTHVILDICILITLDGLHPYIVGYEDGRRFSARLFYKTITELKKQTHLQRFYFALLNISLVLNFAFWIGLILMGLIPGYIHTPTGFLNIISRIAISFGSIDMESAVLGVMYSLIAVVPLFGANHVVGIIASLKQNGIMLWVFIISLLLCCIADMVYLAFSSDIVNFRLCFCEKGTHCTEYNLTAIENEHQNVCGDLFSNSSSVLLAYIVLTLIVHIIGLCLGIKFMREIRRTRVGIDGEDNNLLKETHLELSINQEHGGVPNQRIGEHLSTQSHAENQGNASGSENAGPTNESIKEMSSSQNIQESEESVAEYGNTVPSNKMTEDNLSSLNITGSNQAENTVQNVETKVQYESSSEVLENNESVIDNLKEDVNNTGQDQRLIKN